MVYVKQPLTALSRFARVLLVMTYGASFTVIGDPTLEAPALRRSERCPETRPLAVFCLDFSLAPSLPHPGIRVRTRPESLLGRKGMDAIDTPVLGLDGSRSFASNA